MVLHYLAAQSIPVLAIAGHSKGAVVALKLASQTRELPCKLIVSVSSRFDSHNIPSKSRFTPTQLEELERTGSFTWLNYRAGPEPERSERRPYIVTQQSLDDHSKRSLECVCNLPEGTAVLGLHGKADGTVPYEQTLRMDAAIQKGKASCDVMLMQGVAHNWVRS